MFPRLEQTNVSEAGDNLHSCMVCGISFHRSPVEVREKAAVPLATAADAYGFLLNQPGIRECMVLSTCNRTELYLAAEPRVDARELFLSMVHNVRGHDLAPLGDQVYVLRGVEAVAHSFRVASSLDSLVVGEPQILGQIKAAFRIAEHQEAIGKDLHRWLPRAFLAAKRVRRETGVAAAGVSVGCAAVQLATKISGSLAGRSVVLLGAGKMGELAALHLKEAGAASITVVNRTIARAEEICARCAGVAVPFEGRLETVTAADVIICSTDAPQFTLTYNDIQQAMSSGRRRPVLILDISVPRNVDPRVAEITGVHLYNIDDLRILVEASRASRCNEAKRAELILREMLEAFIRDDSHARLAPAIAAMRNQVHSICQAELERHKRRDPEITPEECEELELMLHRIAQKVLHPVIIELKVAEERTRFGTVQATAPSGPEGDNLQPSSPPEADLNAIEAELRAMAHRMNNPLAIIMGYGQLALMQLPGEGKARADMERVYAEAQRLARLVEELHAYAMSLQKKPQAESGALSCRSR